MMNPLPILLAELPGLAVLVQPVSSAEKTDTMLRLGLAAVFGMLLGWERGRSDKPADGRTMMLIAIGASGFALLGVRLLEGDPANELVRTDPTRVLAYIISGVGFLGAGAILHSKKSVIGLTTAASIWCAAAVGAACGLGEFLLAFFLFALVYVSLWVPWVGHQMRGTDFQNGNGKSNGNGKDRDKSKPASDESPL